METDKHSQCAQLRVLRMAQRELLHELVERSRERVVQVRAGSSLLHVLHQEHLKASPLLSTSTSLPLLPPAPTLAIATKRRTHKSLQVESALDDEHKARRRRGALPRLAKDVVQLPEGTTSFEQYQNFLANKIYKQETMHLQNRRAALVPKADLLKKLATVCAAALKEMEDDDDTPSVSESLREKLLRAMALLRGGRAFEQAKSLAPPPPPAYGEIKNAHLAFLQFKQDEVNGTKKKQVHPWVFIYALRDFASCLLIHATMYGRSAGLQDGNTSTKTPIHFGDQICLLSSSSDLPLAIGPDGRSRPTQDSSAGPHMTFTIVDFRNPSRCDEVTSTDDFWLRVDPAVLGPHKFDPRRRCNGDDTDLSGDGDISSLLSDTSYYLGCPGWQVDDESNSSPLKNASVSIRSGNTQINEHRQHGQKHFRLVAMKALTPSRDVYGDDAATREYAVETNESIMRLARWRFMRYTPRKHEQLGGKAEVTHNGQDVNDAMVNCSTVYLVLSDFALVYDVGLKRGVGMRVSSNAHERSNVAKLHQNGIGQKEPRHLHANSEMIANVMHLSACARWQVRILQRTGGVNYLQELELAMAAVTGDYRKEDGVRVEWLREKQEKMASDNRRLHVKTKLVPEARRQYDLVASQSNSKLEQIERQKGAQATEYFQRRLHELEVLESRHQPYEILHLKQRQLQRVVELPRL
ncbi:hypothetical protein P3T76_012850 [Phytophthora citrophthora]|uniref:Uncharacterized protein n=1 Tax=Phytophthora citrophthora TaxID=4793 RepID=A0AAD9LCL3_9STRA|nr:hypothetical protein P3T76_012850 [Phytophthora citrophthora]